MTLMQHHYGARWGAASTPFWRVVQNDLNTANRTMPVLNRIAVLRKERGLSRPKLAALVGTSYQQIERLEKGDRRLSDVWINRLANAFGVPAQELIADTNLPSEEQLQQMIDLALSEVPLGASREDSTRIVAASLRAQLEQLQAGVSVTDSEDEPSDPDTGALSRAPTRQGDLAE